MLYQLILSVVLLRNCIGICSLPTLPQAIVDTSMPSTAVIKTVCASGCNYTNDQLQQAIDEAPLRDNNYAAHVATDFSTNS